MQDRDRDDGAQSRPIEELRAHHERLVAHERAGTRISSSEDPQRSTADARGSALALSNEFERVGLDQQWWRDNRFVADRVAKLQEVADRFTEARELPRQKLAAFPPQRAEVGLSGADYKTLIEETGGGWTARRDPEANTIQLQDRVLCVDSPRDAVYAVAHELRHVEQDKLTHELREALETGRVPELAGVSARTVEEWGPAPDDPRYEQHSPQRDWDEYSEHPRELDARRVAEQTVAFVDAKVSKRS